MTDLYYTALNAQRTYISERITNAYYRNYYLATLDNIKEVSLYGNSLDEIHQAIVTQKSNVIYPKAWIYSPDKYIDMAYDQALDLVTSLITRFETGGSSVYLGLYKKSN